MEIDKKEMLIHMITAIIEGQFSIDQAKADAENHYKTSLALQRGDLLYIALCVKEFVRKNEQWSDDNGNLVTSESGQRLLFLIQKY